MSSRTKRRKRKNLHWIFKLIILIGIIIICANLVTNVTKSEIYPREYGEYVYDYSKKYNIDPDFIYAIIKTESNFDPNAQSEVGARGLMQIMEDAYEWAKFKIKDDRDITYDQMFEPEYNIEYGCFMLGYYYEKYGSFELAAAAYHSGMTTVDNWIADGTISLQDLNVEDIPASKTQHYVTKVMRSYESYLNLYDTENN